MTAAGNQSRLPAYSYVPGMFPHPFREPQGHSYGKEPPPAAPVTADKWRDSAAYLHACDLFDSGYYWEAHEAWESLWLAAGRHGETADFLKGLIKLAAAGVKAREGNVAGVRRHSSRAIELLEAVRQSHGEAPFLGISLRELIGQIQQIASAPESIIDPREFPVVVVIPFPLQPATDAP